MEIWKEYHYLCAQLPGMAARAGPILLLGYCLKGGGLDPSMAAYREGHHLIICVMGILKNLINAKVSGNVGSMNFRKRGNQVVVAERSYANSSKGGGATYKQRMHRVRMANVSAVFKAIAAIQARAWENKGMNMSDANMFFKANLAGSPIFLTATEAKNGAAVIAPYVVSEGTLPALAQSFKTDGFHTGIMLPEGWIVGQNTIGALSSAIIENNADFKNGDKLTFAKIAQVVSNVNGLSIPKLNVTYFELTLNVESVAAVSTLANYESFSFAVSEDKELTCHSMADAGFVIHSRLVSAKLYTSSQICSMKAGNVVYTNYSSEKQKTAAMDSYGYKPDVLLTPDAVEGVVDITASVEAITYNGSELSSGATIQAGSVLLITGTDLNRKNLYVTNAGVVLVPQVSTSAKQQYTINRNGTLSIVLNGATFLTCNVEGATTSIESIKFGTSTYNQPQSNLSDRYGSVKELEVKGAELGELTATGAQLTNVGGDANTRTATVTLPSDYQKAWTVSCGSVVILSGTTPPYSADVYE